MFVTWYSCPFCNSDGFTVNYAPPASLEVAAIFSNKVRPHSDAGQGPDCSLYSMLSR